MANYQKKNIHTCTVLDKQLHTMVNTYILFLANSCYVYVYRANKDDHSEQYCIWRRGYLCTVLPSYTLTWWTVRYSHVRYTYSSVLLYTRERVPTEKSVGKRFGGEEGGGGRERGGGWILPTYDRGNRCYIRVIAHRWKIWLSCGCVVFFYYTECNKPFLTAKRTRLLQVRYFSAQKYRYQQTL